MRLRNTRVLAVLDFPKDLDLIHSLMSAAHANLSTQTLIPAGSSLLLVFLISWHWGVRVFLFFLLFLYLDHELLSHGGALPQ